MSARERCTTHRALSTRSPQPQPPPPLPPPPPTALPTPTPPTQYLNEACVHALSTQCHGLTSPSSSASRGGGAAAAAALSAAAKGTGGSGWRQRDAIEKRYSTRAEGGASRHASEIQGKGQVKVQMPRKGSEKVEERRCKGNGAEEMMQSCLIDLHAVSLVAPGKTAPKR